MLNWLIDTSLRHRGVVLVVALLLVATGMVALAHLSLDAIPDVTDVLVQVNTVAPALAPLEVEQQISAKVEQVMSGLPGLRLVRSMSKFGLSQVTLVFEDGTDLYFARAQVLERLQSVELPAGIERPTMGPVATGLGEIYHYLIAAPGGDLTESRALQDWVVKPRLLAVPGVAEVNSWGGFERQYQVRADPVLLVKYDLTMRDLLEALERSNANVGGGFVHGSGEVLLVHGLGLTTTTREIGGVTLRTHDGRPVRVRDVAEVVEGHALRGGVVTAGGRGEAVLGLGFMLMGQNSHVVAEGLSRRMAEVQKDVLPPGSTVQVVYDRTELVDLVLRTVRRNLFEGALLVVAVLFLFLGRFRAALIVAAVIPLSMLCAANLMVRAGIAGTLMSLGAIDFGLIVDSSVILVENAVRRLDEDRGARPVREVVADAAKEVRAATAFGELIIMIVYLPILALEGVEGKLFRPMALTVVFALAGSLLLSMTLIPVLASFLLRRGSAQAREPWIARALERLYRPVVAWAVRTPALVLGAALICVAGTVPLALKLGAVFVPRLDEGSIVINTVRFPGVSAEESARFGTRIERLLLERFPDEIRALWTRTGTPEVATDPMGLEVSDVFILLTPAERWTRAHTKDDLLKAIDAVLKPLPGMSYAFTQPIEMRFNEMIAGIRTDVGVKIFGDDFAVLKEEAAKVEALLRTVPGAGNPTAERIAGQPVLSVKLDPEALSRYGLRARDVLDLVEAAGGKEVGEVRVGDRRFPLAVRLPERYLANAELFGTLLVPAPGGERLPLARLARIERTTGPLAVTREWRKRRVQVTTNVVDRDLGGFVAEAKARIDRELGPELRAAGCSVEFGGQYENLVRASRTLSFVVPLALCLILFLVHSTFGDLGDTLRVFTGVPFAAVGGVLALRWRGLPFSVSAGVGFIAVSGVAVLAALVLVSLIRQLRAQGMGVEAAVVHAAERRLRPVLMTALVAGLGFVPMATSTGVGAEVQRPLATVVIGGVVSSTLLTLVVLPALYLALRRRPAAVTGVAAGAAAAGGAGAEAGRAPEATAAAPTNAAGAGHPCNPGAA